LISSFLVFSAVITSAAAYLSVDAYCYQTTYSGSYFTVSLSGMNTTMNYWAGIYNSSESVSDTMCWNYMGYNMLSRTYSYNDYASTDIHTTGYVTLSGYYNLNIFAVPTSVGTFTPGNRSTCSLVRSVSRYCSAPYNPPYYEPPMPPSNNNKGLPGWAVTLIVLAVLGFVAALVVGIVLCATRCCKKKYERVDGNDPNATAMTSPVDPNLLQTNTGANVMFSAPGAPNMMLPSPVAYMQSTGSAYAPQMMTMPPNAMYFMPNAAGQMTPMYMMSATGGGMQPQYMMSAGAVNNAPQ